MPERHTPEMRSAGRSADVRARVIMLASVAGALALVIAIGALIVGTFPKPSTTQPAAKRAATAASVPAKPVASAAVSATATATAAVSKPAAPVKKAATPKKPVAKKKAAEKAAPILPPLGMARVLPGSTQLIVATGAKLGATHGTLRIFNRTATGWQQVFSAAARFGTNGLIDGTKRKQGSRTTPTGIWWPGAWVWGWHKSAPAGTLMPYRQTTQSVWWSDENNSTYNTWVVSSNHVSGEHLVNVKIQYEFALSSGYNSPPNNVVRGRGTAIFLHVFDPPDYHSGLTAGCVALSRANMIKVFQTMDPTRHPCFAVGTEAAGAGSISSY
jgi:L,D-peptidoglycan transpeptidase YkuD (ErfK/YbiS/YcfS/YnhG family)